MPLKFSDLYAQQPIAEIFGNLTVRIMYDPFGRDPNSHYFEIPLIKRLGYQIKVGTMIWFMKAEHGKEYIIPVSEQEALEAKKMMGQTRKRTQQWPDIKDAIAAYFQAEKVFVHDPFCRTDALIPLDWAEVAGVCHELHPGSAIPVRMVPEKEGMLQVVSPEQLNQTSEEE